MACHSETGVAVSDPLTIRSAVPADFEQWLPLWEGYNSFYERSVPAEVTRMTWSRFFDAYEPMHAIVAERDGQLLGLVHYLFHRNTAMLGPTCYLQDLFTLAKTRGQGIGRALIEAVYERAQAAGSPRVYWMTQESNATARRLYDQVAEYSGFIQYRRQF
jgi:GNAT superfamily N-acetyltransferase